MIAFQSKLWRGPFLATCLVLLGLPGDELLAQYSVEDAETRRNREKLYAATMRIPSAIGKSTITPNWLKHTEGFWYLQNDPPNFVVVTPSEKKTLFDSERLAKALSETTGKQPTGDGVPFDSITFSDDGGQVSFEYHDARWQIDLSSYEITSVDEQKPGNVVTARELRPGFTAGAPGAVEIANHTRDQVIGDDEVNLYVRQAGSDQKRFITTDGQSDFQWSVQAAQWSPDDRYVVAAKQDARGLDQLPVVDFISENMATVEEFPYTLTGRPLPRTQLHVVDIQTGRATQLDGTGLEDRHIHLIGWQRAAQEIWFQRIDRRFQHLDLLASDPKTGKTRIVLSEQSDTFIGALNYIVSVGDYFFSVADGEQFLWISERDNWRHLYLYHNDGTLVRRLTEGPWEVERVVSVDEENGLVYFLGHAEPDPYETHLYQVNLDGTGQKRITEGAGQHNPILSPSKKSFVDTWSNPTDTPVVEYRDANGKLLTNVAQVDDKFEQFGWRDPEAFVCQAADGKADLYGLLFRRNDFDPSRKYPVVDYIYNGPFIRWVPRTFGEGRAASAQALANLGFIVIIVDGRGTVGRGKKFQDVVYKNWGRNEIPDHAAVLKQLTEERPWMDTDRVGIHGGSWGGYMTLRAMLTHPDVYHVGVAVAFVADLYDHAAVAVEGYMGLPDDHPKQYEYASNLRLADQLKGKLLLIHGTADVNACFSACMKMTSALIKANKPHDMAILPGANHWAQGKEAAYLDRVRREYFVEHLHADRIVPVAQAK